VPTLKQAGFEVQTHGLSKGADLTADLSNADDATRCLGQANPDAIVNLVCLSNVDACERDPDLAYRLNVRTLENIGLWLGRNRSVRLLHLSTDQVYDSPAPNPEENVVLRNYYAFSKYASEQVALRAGGLVIRTNFFGRSHTEGKKSFSDWIRESLSSGASVTLFTDVLFSPLSMGTLSAVISEVLPKMRHGVINVGSRDGMSKRDFAHRLATRLGLSTASARDGLSTDVSLVARRPTGMIMDCTKFEREFGIALPTLEDEILHAEV
jgi:dTDP-4-dehydrorhamnose reductase